MFVTFMCEIEQNILEQGKRMKNPSKRNDSKRNQCNFLKQVDEMWMYN